MSDTTEILTGTDLDEAVAKALEVEPETVWGAWSKREMIYKRTTICRAKEFVRTYAKNNGYDFLSFDIYPSWHDDLNLAWAALKGYLRVNRCKVHIDFDTRWTPTECCEAICYAIIALAKEREEGC